MQDLAGVGAGPSSFDYRSGALRSASHTMLRVGALTRDAAPLLTHLQAKYARITCGNEPAESPAVGAFVAAGFRETWRRYEMTIEL